MAFASPGHERFQASRAFDCGAFRMAECTTSQLMLSICCALPCAAGSPGNRPTSTAVAASPIPSHERTAVPSCYASHNARPRSPAAR
jgi:hypothetical protein